MAFECTLSIVIPRVELGGMGNERRSSKSLDKRDASQQG